MDGERVKSGGMGRRGKGKTRPRAKQERRAERRKRGGRGTERGEGGLTQETLIGPRTSRRGRFSFPFGRSILPPVSYGTKTQQKGGEKREKRKAVGHGFIHTSGEGREGKTKKKL